jgi:predicted transcriptional regulator
MSQFVKNSLITEKKREKIVISDSFPQDISITNKTDKVVIKALEQNQPATRMDLCKATGIPRTTIYDSLTRLMLRKRVTRYSEPSKNKGRPKVYYRTG